ncbi:MAG: DMT family transporter [Aestuariivirga sp.]
MTRLSANASLLLAAALWGFGNVCQKTVLDDLGPFTTVGFRCLIGLLIILPLLSQERIARQRSSRPSLKLLALISLLFAGGMVTQQASFASTTVTNGSFLITTTTVFTPLVAWLLHRLWPSPVIWMAIVGCLIGTFLMAGGQWSSVATGDILCLISAMIYSVWFVVLGDAVVRHGRPILITVSQFLGAGLLCLATGLALEAFDMTRLMAALPELVLLGVVSTGLAFVLQTIAQQHTSATEAAIISSAEGLFGTLAAMALLGERLSQTSIFGAALIMSAVLAVALSPAPMPRRTKLATRAASLGHAPPVRRGPSRSL